MLPYSFGFDSKFLVSFIPLTKNMNARLSDETAPQSECVLCVIRLLIR